MCEGKINANEKIEKMLSLRLEDLSKKSFIRDWKAVVNIRNKEQAVLIHKRDKDWKKLQRRFFDNACGNAPFIESAWV